eukprot:COSAG01_NODE_1410_length_10411_cov_7.944337_6_plen_157_part_00
MALTLMDLVEIFGLVALRRDSTLEGQEEAGAQLPALRQHWLFRTKRAGPAARHECDQPAAPTARRGSSGLEGCQLPSARGGSADAQHEVGRGEAAVAAAAAAPMRVLLVLGLRVEGQVGVDVEEELEDDIICECDAPPPLPLWRVQHRHWSLGSQR